MLAAMLAVMFSASSAFAQSIEPNSPTPVVSNEITGRIAPLDIGDARLTRFFYTFNGLQGDLELTVESYNLDGDIDIYLAGNLRPLTKVTLYAGASATKFSKSVYLRRDEPLILRVQARTPNDAEGTYRITFGGAFRPADRLASSSDTASSGEPTPASPTPTPARSANRNVRRVTSTGARIEEPVAEVAVKEEAEKVEKTPEEPPAAAPAKATPRPRPARNRTRGNTRTQTARRSAPGTGSGGDTEKGETPKPEESRPETAEAEATPAKAKPERARPVRVPRARNNRNTARRTDAPPAEVVPTSPAETPAPPAPSPRLVLVMRDGETFERDMSSVRRVTVENGMIVIVSKNGKTERQPMAAVLRMSIEP
jgi:hypothetical protein